MLVFYHQSVVSGLEKELRGKEHEANHSKTILEAYKKSKEITPEEVLKEVNRLRAEVGVTPIVLDERLNASAYLKMRDMIANKYFSHESPLTGKRGATYVFDIMGDNNICNISVSENLSTDSMASIEDTIGGWRNSESHYKAMIDPRVKSMGFATGRGYYNGELLDYSVQHFCLSK